MTSINVRIQKYFWKGLEMLKLAEFFWEKGNQFLKEGKEEKALYYLKLFDDLVN